MERDIPCVGDLVRFRTWEDMESQFGLDRYGDINCRFTFTKEMRELIGQQFVVKGIDSDGEITNHNFEYSIHTDMVELVDPVQEPNFEELQSFLKDFN